MGGELHRGEKWFEVRRIANLKGHKKTIDWLNSQESIVNDIKVYEDSLIPIVEEIIEEKDYTIYTKLELQGLCDEKEISYTEANTKSELIEFLKGVI